MGHDRKGAMTPGHRVSFGPVAVGEMRPARSKRRQGVGISNDDRNLLRFHELRRQRVGCDTTSISMVDMSVNLAGVALRNPVLAAAGTCGYVAELADVLDPIHLGAIVTKSITREPREGHPPWRVRSLGPDPRCDTARLLCR